MPFPDCGSDLRNVRAQRRLYRQLTTPLSEDQKNKVEALLNVREGSRQAEGIHHLLPGALLRQERLAFFCRLHRAISWAVPRLETLYAVLAEEDPGSALRWAVCAPHVFMTAVMW
jgi:hypothetical protein